MADNRSNIEEELEDEFYKCTPPELREAAEAATSDLLPEASKHLYNKFYDSFIVWKNEHKASKITENIVLPFFVELSKKYAPTSLQTKYSFLKSTLKLKHKVDIGKYELLTA